MAPKAKASPKSPPKGGEKSPKAGAETEEEEDKGIEIPEEYKPVVEAMTKLDEQLCEDEKELRKKIQELSREYTKKQQTFLDQRTALLKEKKKEDGGEPTGTPALPGFWKQALKNCPPVAQTIEEHDLEILDYLADIRTEYLDPEDSDKGHKLTFEFAENPFFTNKELTRTWHTKQVNFWTEEEEVTKIEGTEIKWNPGKDVTVHEEKKKVKGGGAKKKKAAAKVSIVPRDSFFRWWFRDLDQEMEEPPPCLFPGGMQDDEDEDEDEDDLEAAMDQDHEKGSIIRDTVIPFALRWFTGEACPDEDEDEDGESEEDGDDDDSEEESEDETPKAKKKAGKKGKKAGAGGDGEGGDKEECKQQ